MRKYEAASGKWAKSADCLTIASALKERYAFRFKEPSKADPQRKGQGQEVSRPTDVG